MAQCSRRARARAQCAPARADAGSPLARTELPACVAQLRLRQRRLTLAHPRDDFGERPKPPALGKRFACSGADGSLLLAGKREPPLARYAPSHSASQVARRQRRYEGTGRRCRHCSVISTNTPLTHKKLTFGLDDPMSGPSTPQLSPSGAHLSPLAKSSPQHGSLWSFVYKASGQALQ